MLTHFSTAISAGVFSILACLSNCNRAFAQDADPAAEQLNIQLEKRGPEDAQPTDRPAQSTSPRTIIVFGDFVSIQANINTAGANILGDAANEPSLAVDPTAPNRIAIGWRQFDSIISSFREAGYSYSVDGGRTWARKAELDSGQFRSDPVLAEAPDGTLYYLSLKVTAGNQFSNDIFLSDDGGATWPIQHFAVGGDKAWLEVDPNTGVLYQAWNIAGNPFAPAQFSRSLDGGATWMQPIFYDHFNLIDPALPSFGILDSGPNGELYVAGARNASPSNTFWVVRANNPFAPKIIPSFAIIRNVDMGGALRLAVGPNPAGLLGQLNVSVDHSDGPTRGYAYVLGSIEPPGSDPMDIHLIRSTDGGQSWDAPVRVNDDAIDNGAWQWFGTMDVAPTGRIDVVWNDTRNSNQTNISQLYYSFSLDGGESWSVNEPISPLFNSHLGWPQQAKLGDYYDMISDATGAHLIYAATFNNEQDLYYLRIGDYDCNGNGIGDSDDIVDRGSNDCNENGIPDECELAALAANDLNDNGIPDICDCLEDVEGANNVVDVFDLLALLAAWGTDALPAIIAEPFDDVDETDLVELLEAWGACP